MFLLKEGCVFVTLEVLCRGQKPDLLNPEFLHQILRGEKKLFSWPKTADCDEVWSTEYFLGPIQLQECEKSQSVALHTFRSIYKPEVILLITRATSVTLECHVSYISFFVCLKIWLNSVIFLCSCWKKDVCMLLYPEKKVEDFVIS